MWGKIIGTGEAPPPPAAWRGNKVPGATAISAVCARVVGKMFDPEVFTTLQQRPATATKIYVH